MSSKKKQEKENKVKVHEFECSIYPRTLWIIIGDGIPEGYEGVEMMMDTALAQTTCTYHTESHRGGVMLRFKSKSVMTSEIIAHESTHAAIFIADYIGAEINLESQEYFAYLVGWIAKCCNEVKNFRAK